MNEADHLAAFRQQDAEQVFGPPAEVGPNRSDGDPVEIAFDWETPARANDPLIFLLTIRRGKRESFIRFDITLARFAGADLQRLHDFLASGYQLTFEISWLLGLSLEQEMPASSLEERQQRVRELLLY
jgi:hypothetical protein